VEASLVQQGVRSTDNPRGHLHNARSFDRSLLKGGEDAVQLARFLRLAQDWGILTIGSAITFVAAVIQLALAYSGLESPAQLDRAHQRLRPGTRKDQEGAVAGEQIRLGH